MAFAFDRTLAALGQKPGEEKQDIFGGGMGLTDSGQPNALRSDSSAELGPNTGGGGVNAGEGIKQGNDVSSNAAVSANVGRVKVPANLAGLRKSVDDTRGAAQKEADSYVTANTGATALSEGDKANLLKAVDPEANNADGTKPGTAVGGPQQYSPSSMEYWAQQSPQNVKAVDPFKSSVSTTNETIEGLGTDAGIQGLLRRGNGPEYSAGDAGFDQALLSQDQGFNQQRDDLNRAYGQLQNDTGATGELGGAKTSERGQTAANTAYGSYLDDLKAQLGGLETKYTDAAKLREKTIEDRAALESNSLREGGIDAHIAALQSDPNNAGMSEYINGVGMDPNSYYTQNFNPDQYGWQDYLDGGQANTFNNIMGLLRKKDVYGTGLKAGGLSGADLGTFDDARLNADLIGQGVAGKTQADAAAAQKAAAEKALADERARVVHEQQAAMQRAHEAEMAEQARVAKLGPQTQANPENIPFQRDPNNGPKEPWIAPTNAPIGNLLQKSITDPVIEPSDLLPGMPKISANLGIKRKKPKWLGG